MDRLLSEQIEIAFRSAREGRYLPLGERTGTPEDPFLFAIDETLFMIAHGDFRQKQSEAISETSKFFADCATRLPTKDELDQFAATIIALRQAAIF